MQFAFTLMSKHKFSEELSDDELVMDFRKRFEHLPLQFIDMVFVHSLDVAEKEATSAMEQVMLNEGSENGLARAHERSSDLNLDKKLTLK